MFTTDIYWWRPSTLLYNTIILIPYYYHIYKIKGKMPLNTPFLLKCPNEHSSLLKYCNSIFLRNLFIPHKRLLNAAYNIILVAYVSTIHIF